MNNYVVKHYSSTGSLEGIDGPMTLTEAIEMAEWDSLENLGTEHAVVLKTSSRENRRFRNGKVIPQ